MRPITKCDECNIEDFQDNLVNLHYDLNVELGDIKDEFLEYDGMVCQDCFDKIFKK